MVEMDPEIAIQTERLILRPWRADELGTLHALLSHPATMRHWPAPLSDNYIRDWHNWARQLWAERRLGRMAVERAADGLVIGDCGLVPMALDGVPVTDLGYIIHADHHGLGYGVEAARAVLEYGHTIPGLDDIVCHMATDHVASQKVARALGMIERCRFKNPKNAGKVHIVFALS